MMNLKNTGTAPADAVDGVESDAAEVADDRVIYSCYPIMRLSIGGYHFKDGQLLLPADQCEAFDSLLAEFPGGAGVKKIDIDAAHDMAVAYLKTRTIRGVDTSEDRPN